MSKQPAGAPLVVFLCILAAVVNLSHLKCEKRTKFTQTTDSFTVVFSACNQFDDILQAWLEPRGNVQNNRTHIWVHFTPKNLTSGSHFYRIGYLYFHMDRPSDVGQRNGIQLHLRVADFNLKASTLQPVVGDNITLYCSSGLSKAIDVMVNFTFQTHNKTELVTKQFVCNESNYHLENKWIHRTGTIPHDCILEIIGVDESDSGTYQCIGDLRSSGIGESEDAPSNIVNVSVIAHEDTLLQAFVTIVTPVNESTQVISISIGATMILILIVLSVIGWHIRKKYYNNEQDQPYVPIGGESIAEREGEDDAGAGQVESSGSSGSGSTGTSSKLTSTESQHREEDSLQFPMERDQASDTADNGDAHVPLTQTVDRDSTGSPREDQPVNLAENLSEDIREQVSFVRKLTQTPGETPQDNEAPEDQNLRCCKCGHVYKIGEIQFLRQHCKKCHEEL